MKLHPTRGYRECRNTRIKKTNRRVKPRADVLADREIAAMSARIGRLTQPRFNKSVRHVPNTSAGIGSTLFKIEPWVPSPDEAKKIQQRHVHPRHKRPVQVISRPR